ncbi:MAG: PSD1 domain-containing protein [Isosphaeraceae bacterium]|nr:PSD1 domain-containing protein [Isosphaeraceae bacterium]
MGQPFRSVVGVGLIPMVLMVGAAWAGEAPPDRAGLEFFEAKVRPVLAAHCFECHGPEKQKGGLRLDDLEAMRAGGDTGPAIVPGDPENSLLIEAIRYEGAYQMPPKGKLSEAEIAVVTEWVRRGAPWPTAGREARPAKVAETFQITDEDRAFWAFQPVKEAPPPAVQDRAWPKTSIDPFILARLEEKGLRPAPPADKRTLIRRVTFDLTGLPPTPEEVENFLKDESPDAFARVVERLLASPHYGERWGRHWLDIARYGEDQAHSFKPRLYPNGFRYRDWLIAAFNRDLPYDRFLLEQIAGDLLEEPGRHERLPALGFFALGPVYYGDPKKLDQYDDRIDTLTRGLLGLTVACARCHDHKYDPISQADYYALAGVFASTEYVEAAPIVPREQVEAYERAQAAIQAKWQEIDTFLSNESTRLVEARAAEIARYMVAAWKLREQREDEPKAPAATVAGAEGLDAARLERWVAYLASDKAKDRPHLAPWFALLESRGAKEEPCSEEEALRAVREVAASFQEQARVLLARRDEFQAGKAANAATAKGGGAAQQGAAPASPQPDKVLFDDLFGEKGLLSVPKDQLESLLPPASRSKLAALRAEWEGLKKQAPPMYPVAHALTEGPKPTDMNVLVRGNPDTPGGRVPRRFLAILGGEGKPFAQGSGRLELARAIIAEDNPLTARVMVNRIWQHHFGRGLVATPSNFGALGERPTHPELLDHLASRFLASGWSIKAIHRLILLSATYQQSSRLDEQAHELDPANTLLWRQNRRRLEVEAWRDAILAVSGRLDPTIGGPSVNVEDPDNRRRTVYAAVSRHDLAPLLRLLDFPDPNITSAERTQTTVPLQQLLVLNSEFLIRSAQALAARLTSQPDEDDAARIQRAYELLFARAATDAEVRLGLAYLRSPDRGEAGALTRWERYAQALLAANEFMYVD